jgi:hypothetical protein
MGRVSVIVVRLLKFQEKPMFCKSLNGKCQTEIKAYPMKNIIVLSTALALLLCVVSGTVGCAQRKLSPWPAPDSATKGIVLFDGTGFDHWTDENGGPVEWKILNGAMEVVPNSGSIITKQMFGDIRLHVEFNVPRMPADAKGQYRGNSGIYIQRRYEVQILDSYGKESTERDCGAIYRLKAPDKNVCKEPEEWQSYDIHFRAARFEGEGVNAKKVENARITVYQNGVLIHNDVDVTNKTGLGKPEGPEDAPILLQNHGYKVKFRNIWVERVG